MDLAKHEENHEAVGFRFIDKFFGSEPTVGDELENSHVWDGDEPTEDELRGTCAFADWADMEKYAQYSKGAGWIVVIGGTDEGRGDIAGEILIGTAQVLEVIKW